MSELEYVDLLGKEFEYGGRGPDTFDCWGLCEEIYKRLGREYPPYPTPADVSVESIGGIIKREMKNYRWLEEPEPYCFVVFAIRPPYASHIGVVMEDCKSFLHIMRKRRVAREPLDNIIWKKKRVGFYRWESSI